MTSRKTAIESDDDEGSPLASLVEVITELAVSASVEEICRSGVELGRERLGFDRLGIWFFEDEDECFRGSFGTDSSGNTRDERACRAPVDPSKPLYGPVPEHLRFFLTTALSGAREEGRAVTKIEARDVHSWRTGDKLGEAAAVFAVMRDRRDIIGFLGSDNLFSRRTFSERQMQVMTLYASSLGHLISRQRAVDAYRRKGEEQEELVAERTRELAATVKELKAEVAERKRTEAALRESERRFSSIWRESTDGMRLTDEEGTTVAVNPAFCELAGMAESELLGKSFTEIYASRKKNSVRMREYRRHFSNPATARRLEGPMELRSGKEIVVEVAFSMIGEGDHRRMLSVFRDITARKRAEEQRLDLERRMLDTQKLEGLTILAGGIAHDFNNLLTGILGNANLGMRQASENSPVRAYLENIEKSSLDAAALCRKMLAYAGQEDMGTYEVNLNEVISRLHHLLRISIHVDIALKVELGEDLPPVNAEASQLEQAVMNLVINAAEATGEAGGEIRIATGVARIDRAVLKKLAFPSELPPGDAVLLEVSDNGQGMTAETLERAFDPFYSTKFTGRGLGLAAVQGIVSTYKGGCEVVSEPGGGTTFRVYLPPVAAGEGSVAAKADSPAEARESGGFILVVDDEAGIREIAKGILEVFGYCVITASDGAEGIEMYRKRRGAIEAVLLDMTMPDMAGIEVLGELRRINPCVFVLLMSGYPEAEAASRVSDDKPDGFLQKPFSLEGLGEAVRDLLSPRSTG